MSGIGYRLKRWSYSGGRLLVTSGGRGSGPPGPESSSRAAAIRLATRLKRLTEVQHEATEDLASWCASRGLESEVLSTARLVRPGLPRPLEGGSVHSNFLAWSETPVPERRLFRIPGARLWGPDGIVVLPDGSLAAESVYDRHHLERNPAYRKPMPRRSRTVKGDHFSLLGPFSNRGNYFHWFHDALLRLHGVQERLPAGTGYLVPPRLAEFQRESLRLLGVPEESLMAYQGELWQPDQLWFASLPPAGAQVSEAAEWLRDRMWSAAGVGSPGLRRRIYISRAGARWGRIANERQLLPVLGRFGFEVVACEQLSVAEQVRLFSDARTIVSPLGAGQTNSLFTPPGARILQILEPSAESRFFVYRGLAETCGHQYHYVIGTTVPNPDRPQYPDLELSPERLERALEAVDG